VSVVALSGLSQEKLLEWYDEHQRDLPWRKTDDPWAILLSEILLQQTQVSRGLIYWRRMMETFPTIQSMAESPVDKVLKAWEGAGYYSRAHRLHSLSQLVMRPSIKDGFDGSLPSSRDALLSLPGIGPYTAAAVSSIAFGQAFACVDGNIRRVMARQHRMTEPSNKEVQSWADEQLVQQRPGDWNQALMELGATICTPKKPQCHLCPINSSCLGKETATNYPKPKKTKIKEITLWTCVEFDDAGNPVIHQRKQNGLFGGLWGPQLYEGKKPDKTGDYVFAGIVSHKLSHRAMTVHVFVSTQQSQKPGRIPSDLALSVLDQKILGLVRKSGDGNTSDTKS
jgi:A/G-specific adenine glycosylase